VTLPTPLGLIAVGAVLLGVWSRKVGSLKDTQILAVGNRQKNHCKEIGWVSKFTFKSFSLKAFPRIKERSDLLRVVGPITRLRSQPSFGLVRGTIFYQEVCGWKHQNEHRGLGLHLFPSKPVPGLAGNGSSK
jgi:hypothetical protein